jgi:hypothetical protein
VGWNHFRYKIWADETQLDKVRPVFKRERKVLRRKFFQHNYTLGFLPQHHAIFLVENCRKFKDSGFRWLLLKTFTRFVFLLTNKSNFSKHFNALHAKTKLAITKNNQFQLHFINKRHWSFNNIVRKVVYFQKVMDSHTDFPLKKKVFDKNVFNNAPKIELRTLFVVRVDHRSWCSCILLIKIPF